MVVLNDIGLTLEIFGFGIFLFVPIMESFGFSQEKLPRIQEFFYQHKSLERGLRLEEYFWLFQDYFYNTHFWIGVRIMPIPEKYKEKSRLRYVKCPYCDTEYSTSMKIPRCSRCYRYIE